LQIPTLQLHKSQLQILYLQRRGSAIALLGGIETAKIGSADFLVIASAKSASTSAIEGFLSPPASYQNEVGNWRRDVTRAIAVRELG
jgi:hypothetical protein